MTGVLHERPTTRGALDAAREVAADVATRAERHDRDGSFAFENIDALWEAGLGNLTLPGAADLRTTAEAVRIVASGDPSTALVWVMHLIQLKLLTADGAGVAPHVREEVIASSLAGPALVNALRVEPDLGTPARGGLPATVAIRSDEGWRLSGRKIFAPAPSRCPAGGYAGARTKPNPGSGSSWWWRARPDVTVEPTWDHLGLRASRSDDVVFADTPVADDHVVGLVPAGAGPGRRSRSGLVRADPPRDLPGRRPRRPGLARRLPAGGGADRLGAPLATLPRFRTAVGRSMPS